MEFLMRECLINLETQPDLTDFQWKLTTEQNENELRERATEKAQLFKAFCIY